MVASPHVQQSLFPDLLGGDATTSTFIDNMKLPVHRWFRYSAGFSAQWVEDVIATARHLLGPVTVLDPFVGSGTTLLAAESAGIAAYGVDAHPFVTRIARAKLHYRSDPSAYQTRAQAVRELAMQMQPDISDYPALVHRCFSEDTLMWLDRLRRAWESLDDGSPHSELVWLTLVAVLRHASHAGTAPWQYILPAKAKKSTVSALHAFDSMAHMVAADMEIAGRAPGPPAVLMHGDARTLQGLHDSSVNLVITSPPYTNNYDYADATRLEMSFFRMVNGWGGLQQAVRQYLIRSCSQHVTERTIDLQSVLASPELDPIRCEIQEVCARLGQERLLHGGKKTYHLMIACYFLDMAHVWQALRRVCARPAMVCVVIGDSAPYGIYVPVMEWMGVLAEAAGFESFHFEKIRDRNVKWKNRKHRVPLCEGRLWVKG